MALVMTGPPNTGKSRVLAATRLLVGPDSASAIPSEYMDDDVRMAAIMHKRLNIVAELHGDAIIRGPGFKTMTGGDVMITVNPKYKDPVSFVPTTKIVISCNELPDVLDRSETTLERMLIIPF